MAAAASHWSSSCKSGAGVGAERNRKLETCALTRRKQQSVRKGRNCFTGNLCHQFRDNCLAVRTYSELNVEGNLPAHLVCEDYGAWLFEQKGMGAGCKKMLLFYQAVSHVL
jgi:hypothetical protein